MPIMPYDPQLEEHERFQALVEEYYVNLYHEWFYTDEEWAQLISDAENFDTDDDLSAQLAEYEHSESMFDQHCHEQWVSFHAHQRPQ